MLLRRYLVRELLWCGICDAPWVPILLGPLSRYYACSNEKCLHPAMPAKWVDHRVWSRFVRPDGPLAQGVSREYRPDVLHQQIRRVVVGQGMVLRFERWGST
jgi:hypothetical protein